jgi:hypothetical protein
MNQRVRFLCFAIVFILAAMVASLAQTSYEDPQERFVIDIPNGWQLAPQTEDNVFVFQGEGKSIIVECMTGMNDPAQLLKKAERTLRAAGVNNPALDGQIMEMTVNGLPVRYGVYKSAPTQAIIVALCGSFANGENGLYFLSIITPADFPLWKDKLEKIFWTIRAKGQKVTGVEGIRVAADAVTPAAKPTPWSSELVSLTLPPGWTESPRPRGIEKEVQGIFANADFPGVLLMAVCYKGFGMSMSKALDAGIKSFKIPVPNAQPMDVNEIKIEGKKVIVVVYKGASAGAGMEVELGAVIAVIKADKCYTNLIAMGTALQLAGMKTQVLETVKTVR